MREKLPLFSVLLIALAVILAAPGSTLAAAKISASEYKAGGTVTIEGTIEPGQDLYIAVAQQKMFAVKDTDGVHEQKRFKKDMKKAKFNADTAIPPLYYLITTNPDAFGKEGKKKFGGPSVLLGKGNGIYSTTMYYLNKKFADVSAAAKAMLGPIKSEEQWNFLRYANESSFGINTIVKEGNNVGKVTIFSRTVITDHNTSGKYWDKGTTINLDQKTGKFTASFKSFRHTPPDTQFDVYVNGAKSGSYTVLKNGFWLSKGFRYMNPLWIVIGAVLVGTYFSMIGAAGGMLMAAFQVLIVQTAGPVGINAAADTEGSGNHTDHQTEEGKKQRVDPKFFAPEFEPVVGETGFYRLNTAHLRGTAFGLGCGNLFIELFRHGLDVFAFRHGLGHQFHHSLNTHDHHQDGQPFLIGFHGQVG